MLSEDFEAEYSMRDGGGMSPTWTVQVYLVVQYSTGCVPRGCRLMQGKDMMVI